jgi:hypothetical protein
MLREFIISFLLVAVCVSIHSSGLVILFQWLLRRRSAIERRRWIVHYTLVLIVVFFLIIILHLAETAIWAAFYSYRGLFENYETSLYFSLVSYSTIGYGDVVLPERWRLLGSIEGISGVLLCGLSTAFVFAIINSVLQIRLQQRSVAEQAPEVESTYQ